MKEKIDLPLYYGASVEIFRRAEVLRNHMTESEKLLWDRLTNEEIITDIDNVIFQLKQSLSLASNSKPL